MQTTRTMLSVTSVTVAFGGLQALDGLDLEVAAGEVVAILGRSGCGKSTLLRAVAGLQPLDAGDVRWDGGDLTGVPVHRRGFGLMFQDHALFAHRDVAANVAFGLRMQKMPTSRRRRRVQEALSLVGLAGFEERRVGTLSGGEAQRVALARSLAPEPRLLMLDEPLGSLDRPRRDELTGELRTLLRRTGTTALHVTHDHDEAFAVADRVAVMRAGRIDRIGTPADIWSDPRREHVARFLGHSNIITVGESGTVPWGRIEAPPGRVVIRADAFSRTTHTAPTPPTTHTAPTPPTTHTTHITHTTPTTRTTHTAPTTHTTHTAPTTHTAETNTVTGTVSDVRFRGCRFELTLHTEPGGAELLVSDASPAHEGDILSYSIDTAAVMSLD